MLNLPVLMGVVKTYCNVTACWASLPLPHSSSQTAFIHSENAGTASRLFPAIGDYYLPKLWRTDSNGGKGTQKQLSEINKLKKKKNPSKCSFFLLLRQSRCSSLTSLGFREPSAWFWGQRHMLLNAPGWVQCTHPIGAALSVDVLKNSLVQA